MLSIISTPKQARRGKSPGKSGTLRKSLSRNSNPRNCSKTFWSKTASRCSAAWATCPPPSSRDGAIAVPPLEFSGNTTRSPTAGIHTKNKATAAGTTSSARPAPMPRLRRRARCANRGRRARSSASAVRRKKPWRARCTWREMARLTASTPRSPGTPGIRTSPGEAAPTPWIPSFSSFMAKPPTRPETRGTAEARSMAWKS